MLLNWLRRHAVRRQSLGTILGNPAKDLVEISDRLNRRTTISLVTTRRQPKPMRSSASSVRFQEFAVRIGATATNLGHLCIGQAHVAAYA